MPGIVGFAGREEDPNANNKYLSSMAYALEDEELFQRELFSDHRVGIGRVSLRITNPDPQPIWNEGKTIAVVIEGELYGYEQKKSDLESRGYQFRTSSDAEYVLHLYEEYGDRFVQELNGAFVLAVWDDNNKRLLVANDRIGQYPLYYAEVGGRLLFASGMRALLVDPMLHRDVDEVAIAQFLTFNHILGNRSYLVDVKRLLPATILAYQDGRLQSETYWRMEHPKEYELCSELEWMEAILHYLKQAITRQSRGTQPSGLLLSGGLDSRVILAYLGDPGADRRISTFTWGMPGCDDAQYARELSHKMGVANHFFELKSDWLLHNADEGVRRTDGMGNVIALHAMAALEDEVRHARILYKGFMGDGMMGYSLQYQHWADYDETTRIQAHYQVHRGQGAIIFDFPEHERLFTDQFRSRVGNEVFTSYADAMNETGSTLLADQRNVFGLRHRVPRMALNGVEVLRQRAFVRLPFCDNDLVEFSLRVPPGLRYQRRLIKNAFVRAFPDLAQVPVTDTGYPMMDCARDVMMRVDSILRWHLHKAGFSQISYPKKRPYQDYNGWFRTVLRGWMEENLLSPEIESLGYFNQEYVRNLVSEHIGGQNHAVRIGALLSLVLWHKKYLA
jgi:asparagine synthase (glutamine-hydrolysing)